MTTVFKMPLRGTDAAPKFDGTPARLIPYLEDIEQLSDHAGHTSEQRIKSAIRYAPADESETWTMLDEALGKDWDKFVAAVKSLYPGCEGDRRFTRTDLENLCAEQARIPMQSQEDLGQYYRKFFKISRHLIQKKKLAELERDRLFLDGIHTTANIAIRRRLEIRLIDHHPEDPYDLKEVYNAAVFLLPSTSTASQPAAAIPTRTAAPPVAVHRPVTVKQQPSQDIVVKKEYNLSAGCFFCGGDHYPRECRTREEYVRSGKVKWGDNGKLIMADGRRIPYGREDGTFQERIDKYLRDGPASGANATVLGSLFCRAAPTRNTVLDTDPSAFLHTCASHQEDTDEDEEIKRLECEMVKVKEALTAVKQDRANRKAEKGKDKSVRFDGVDIPRPKPGPSSKTIPVEEVASPQVKAAAAPPANRPNPKASVVQPIAKPTAPIPDPLANQPTTQYRYTFPLEDKEADKRVTDRMLDTSVSIPIRELIAVSTDVRKVFKDMTTTKRVTVGTALVNELTGAPVTKQYIKDNDEFLKRSDDGRIVADHFKPLRCIKAGTYQGRLLTCVLDQGAECIVMPARVWRTLGSIPLRPDYKLTMESVNTSTNETLGVVENMPLDFGTGEMLFQVQIVETANFDVLLGRPFYTLTSCKTEDTPSGEQDITLIDPNTGKMIRIPTEPWIKKCPGCAKCAEDEAAKGF